MNGMQKIKRCHICDLIIVGNGYILITNEPVCKCTPAEISIFRKLQILEDLIKLYIKRDEPK